MFDLIKEYNAELVIIDQFLSGKGSDFYLKICVDVEVVKNQRNKEFRAYIFNTVNPKIKNYLTNASLSVDTKYESANFIMMSAILEYFHHPDFGFDDEDITNISNNLNQSDAIEKLDNYFLTKYGEEKKNEYLENAKICFSPMSFALSVYTNYKSAKGNIAITNEHLNTFKMVMGKEFMDTAYGKVSEKPVGTPSDSVTKSGCYIATCVYESYDCPEVWSLRRYRDNYLSRRVSGRLFIKIYYFISPTLVKLFGHTKWFKKIFKKYLDKKLIKLKEEGYSSLPYLD